MKRTLIFTVHIPADVTPAENETQFAADDASGRLIIPHLKGALTNRFGKGCDVFYHGSKDRSAS